MRYCRRGFAMAALIAVGARANAEFVTGSTLNCRSAPTTNAPVVARLVRGDEVRVLAWSGDWARIERERMNPCWAATRYLSGAPESYLATDGSGVAAARPGTARSSGSRSAPRQSYAQPPRRTGSSSGNRARRSSSSVGGACPCSGSRVCIGPGGGRYCITSGGNRRYGV